MGIDVEVPQMCQNGVFSSFLAPRVSASHPMSPCLYSDSENENIDVTLW